MTHGRLEFRPARRPPPGGPRSSPLGPPGRPRRFVLNPVFLAAAGAHRLHTLEAGSRSTVTEIDGRKTRSRRPFFGGFRHVGPRFWADPGRCAPAEPVVGVTPRPRCRRAPPPLSVVAIVPFVCGCLTLLAFLQFHPVGDPAVRGVQARQRRIAVLVGQIVVPSLGGPLLGVAPGAAGCGSRAPRSLPVLDPLRLGETLVMAPDP